MTRTIGLAVALSVSVAAAQYPQVPQTRGLATIVNGRVVADETGAPLPNVRITSATAASATDAEPVPVVTDRDGRFSLTTQAGRALILSKPGYGRTELMPLELNQPMDIRLLRGAVITDACLTSTAIPCWARGSPLKACQARLPVTSFSRLPRQTITASTD